MQKTTELKIAVSELNRNVEGFQKVVNDYRGVLASVSQGMQESLGVLFEKVQSITEMVYLKNSRPESLEKPLNDILEEINTLNTLKAKLYSLSGK
jgi:iron uptake system EfeUOB component EfeO/EfeM